MTISKNRALITGVTGQDGSCIVDCILEKGCEIQGIKRRTRSFNTQLVDRTKAKEGLCRIPEIMVQEMCAEMIAEGLKQAQTHALLKARGHQASMSREN